MLARTIPFVAAALFLFGASVASAADNGIQVSQVWGRATPGNVPTGALYLTVTNTGTAPDRLVGASTPVAAKASVHQMIMNNGVMEMRPVAGLDIPPGKTVVLQPDGYHVMLEGLKAPLKQGDSVPLTLTFEKAGTEQVTATIAGVGAMGPGATGSMPGMSMPGMSH